MEEGKADLGVQDRWGATPLDEAMRAGSRAVMDYLQGINAPTKKDDDRTMEFLYAASRGDTAKLRHVRLSWPRACYLVKAGCCRTTRDEARQCCVRFN